MFRPTTLAGREEKAVITRAYRAARAAAKAAQQPKYHGRACSKCTSTERWTCSARCVACHRVSQKVYRKSVRGWLTNEQRFNRGLPAPTRPPATVCELCGSPPNDGKSLCLDHCHASGHFRGWLCNRCNQTLGKLGDSLESVTKWSALAADYLLAASASGSEEH